MPSKDARSFVDRLAAGRHDGQRRAGAPFADRLGAERIHKVKATDATGRRACYFVIVEPAREAAFLAALKSEASMNLEDFGAVVASNYGEEPSEHVRQLLKERYGYDA